MRLGHPLAIASLALQFLLELVVLTGLAYWGAMTGTAPTRIALGIAAPVAAAIVWAIFGSPKAPFPATGATRALLELVFFGSAALALAVSGQRLLGASFALLAACNIVVLHGLGVHPSTWSDDASGPQLHRVTGPSRVPASFGTGTTRHANSKELP